jgi:hypothetical protein
MFYIIPIVRRRSRRLVNYENWADEPAAGAVGEYV